MRFDFYHCGNQESENYFFDELIEEPYWAGSKTSLIDDSGYGNQMFKIWDAASGELLYSRSYCTLFNEWQTTPEAMETSKCMPESVVFPFPKKDVKLELYARNKKGKFEKKFEYDIRVNSYFIRKFIPKYETFEVRYNGNPEHRVDIVLLPEGYSANEKEKFMEACNTFAGEFFTYSPYKENASRFNIRAVWAPSEESGVTIPGEHIWRRTALKGAYYTFDSERYQWWKTSRMYGILQLMFLMIISIFYQIPKNTEEEVFIIFMESVRRIIRPVREKFMYMNSGTYCWDWEMNM